MEVFQKAKVVRLRSHHDKYLIADEDQDHVTQDRNGLIKNAKWKVEIVEFSQCVRFKSCYGKYLTASNMPFLLGMSGKKVLQTLPRRLDSSLEWEPIREGVQFKLKTRYGQYLRANASRPPYRNHITHDIPHRTSTQDWILWDVDLVEIRTADSLQAPPKSMKDQVVIVPPQRPQLVNNNNHNHNQVEVSQSGSPSTVCLRSPKFERVESDDSIVGVPAKNEGRMIYYNVANENGQVDEIEKKSLVFKGFGVEELKQKLEEETGLREIHVCSKNPLNSKLYPLRLHLPPNNTDLNLVVVPKESSIIGQLQSPNAM